MLADAVQSYLISLGCLGCGPDGLQYLIDDAQALAKSIMATGTSGVEYPRLVKRSSSFLIAAPTIWTMSDNHNVSSLLIDAIAEQGHCSKAHCQTSLYKSSVPQSSLSNPVS